MPSTSLFNRYPPFPDDVNVIDLPRLSHASLLSDKRSDSSALFKASTEHGFFLLDMSESTEGRDLLADIESAFEIGRTFFNLDLEEKKKFVVNSGNVGYKPMGLMSFADGKRDLTEICAVGKDSILDPSLATIPTVFSNQRAFLTSLIHRLHPLATLILSRLASHLDVPWETLAEFHDPSQSSATVLRFLHNPSQISSTASGDRQASLLGHTDSGSITILFAILGGLQILPNGMDDEPGNWRWVRPEPGCAIINIGDPLVQWTGGVLRSAFHRVLYAPGAQAPCERYSFGYFLKPADEAPMRRIRNGGVIPKLSKKEEVEERKMECYDHWHRNKTKGIMQGKNNAKRGGMVLQEAAA